MSDSIFYRDTKKKQLHPFDAEFKYVAVKFFWNEYAKRCAMSLDREKYEYARSLFDKLVYSFSNPSNHCNSPLQCYDKSRCEQYIFESLIKESGQHIRIDCINEERSCSYFFKEDEKECLDKFVCIAKDLQKKYPVHIYEFYSYMDVFMYLQSYIVVEEERCFIPEDCRTSYSGVMDVSSSANDDSYQAAKENLGICNSMISLYDFLPVLRVPFFEEIVFGSDLNINIVMSRKDFVLSKLNTSEESAQYKLKEEAVQSRLWRKPVHEEIMSLTKSAPSLAAWNTEVEKRMSNGLLLSFRGNSILWRLVGLVVWDFNIKDGGTYTDACDKFQKKFEYFLLEMSKKGFKSPFFEKVTESNYGTLGQSSLTKTKKAVAEWGNRFRGKIYPDFIDIF